MKYVFVGDIHGKVEAVERALERDGMKIFVGDFTDSYDRRTSEYGTCLRLVLDAIQAGNARSIYGNHELSYLMPRKHRCSGYTEATDRLLRAFEPEIREHFEPHIWLEDSLLVTHAGLTLPLWEEHGLTLDNLDATLRQWWSDADSPAHGIGYARGGSKPYGGTFWCDFNREFRPVPGLSQVFGHTRGDGIRSIEQNYCIDCLDTGKEFLEIDFSNEAVTT